MLILCAICILPLDLKKFTCIITFFFSLNNKFLAPLEPIAISLLVSYIHCRYSSSNISFANKFIKLFLLSLGVGNDDVLKRANKCVSLLQKLL